MYMLERQKLRSVKHILNLFHNDNNYYFPRVKQWLIFYTITKIIIKYPQSINDISRVISFRL